MVKKFLFRTDSIGCLGAGFLLIVLPLVLIGPAAIGAWYMFMGGKQYERGQRIRELISVDPAERALDAVNSGNDKVFMRIYDGDERSFPGAEVMNNKPDMADTISMWLIENDPLTQEQEMLNRSLLDYARAYNMRLLEAQRSKAIPATPKKNP